MSRWMAIACATLPSSAVGAAQAQGAYPNQPITVIVPCPPGGGTDVVTRLLAEGSAPIHGSPQQAAQQLGHEQRRWSAVVRESSVKLD